MRQQHSLPYVEGAASSDCCSEKCMQQIPATACTAESRCKSQGITAAVLSAGHSIICFTPKPSCYTSLGWSPLADKEKQGEERIPERCCNRTRWPNSPKPWHCVSFCSLGIFISCHPSLVPSAPSSFSTSGTLFFSSASPGRAAYAVVFLTVSSADQGMELLWISWQYYWGEQRSPRLLPGKGKALCWAFRGGFFFFFRAFTPHLCLPISQPGWVLSLICPSHPAPSHTSTKNKGQSKGNFLLFALVQHESWKRKPT